MTTVTQSIIFEDGEKTIRHVDPGMVKAVLNMHYLAEIAVNGDYMYVEYRENGEGEVFITSEARTNKVATIRNESDMIDTIKEVRNLGNSMGVAMTLECRALGISPGDKVRIRIMKVDEGDD